MKSNFQMILPSTKKFFEEASRIKNFGIIERLHGYIYLHWPYLYIGLGKGDHLISKTLQPIWKPLIKIWPKKEPTKISSGTFADGYHGKVVPTEKAKQLVTINQDIRINDLEQVIPYPKARAIIMHNPDHIVALECPCRAAKENPCTPLEVCLIVGEPFASFVCEHHPERSRWIDQSEAAEILEAERDRGHVSHAFFKDAMLKRFYAICNCCECCCGAMQFHRNGTPMLASSGYICEVDESLCSGCGTCKEKCQFRAVTISDGFSVINYEPCMGCGVCVEHCQQQALKLVLDEKKGVPLEIHQLIAQTATH